MNDALTGLCDYIGSSVLSQSWSGEEIDWQIVKKTCHCRFKNIIRAELVKSANKEVDRLHNFLKP